jgi:ribosomal protein S18 acetylase RimI-like enzyme
VRAATLYIRTMAPSDLDFAGTCTAAEGWLTETRQSFEGFYAHAPAGCFVAELDGKRVGICVATGYDTYGFVGELIVVPEARGQGIGSRLLEHAISYLHGRGVQNILLDGVVAAVSLYERAGFRKVCRSLRFGGPVVGKSHARVRSMRRANLDAALALDREAFGQDRRFLLERRLTLYPELCKVLLCDGKVAGYVMGRQRPGMVAVGPWVVRPDVERPVDLLESLALEAEDNLGLGVLETNHAATRAVRALGLVERADPPWRMALGPSSDLGTSPMAYAIGAPATG